MANGMRAPVLAVSWTKDENIMNILFVMSFDVVSSTFLHLN
jgi:hypothetical protein